MFRKFIAAFVTILFAASIHTTAFAEFIPVDGDIDRIIIGKSFKAGDIFRATGMAVGPKNWDKNDSFYKTFARQAARMDALRFLVETLEGCLDFPNLTEGELLVSDIVKTRISQNSKAFQLLEKNAHVVNVKFFEDGVCEVTMEFVFPADWKEYLKN